ncbi:glycosyltransferase family 4 protein [Streptomyces kronopolitis]|uniref:glycosyltransferase family 4 protein n=1 Tax=Streptomyces kronopolitis TaxID=1612435 RepID=UPI003D99C77C
MRVLALVPLYEQVATAGAYITTREYLRGLAAAGHTVNVVTTVRRAGEPYVEDGVQVWPLRDWRRAVKAAWPELVISHHGDRTAPGILPYVARSPHLLMVHGMSPNRALGAPDLAWFPSQACRRYYATYRGRTLFLPPPIDPGRYRTTPGDLVTLSGATAAKGADVLAEIAARMPSTRFQMVKVLDRGQVPQPPNVEVVDRRDPRRIYARTRLLLMPSRSESYGRVGIEAMLSGIPVIAAPLPGMREAFGDAATYVPREDTARWTKEIERLSDPATYRAASAAARAHADSLDVQGNHQAFEAACVDLVHNAPSATARRQAVSAQRRRTAQVVAWVHYGVPYRRAGSETMLHTLMQELADTGLDVMVLCSGMPEAPESWDVDGVPYGALDPRAARNLIRSMRPKAIVTHHDFAARAIDLAKTIRSKSVLLVHSDLDVAGRTLARQPDMAVYNSHWVRDSLTSRYLVARRIRSLVVHPPVDPDDHRTPGSGRHVTLVNLNRDKGVETWHAAASRLPSLPFLGVTGAHGPQILNSAPANAQVVPQTSDMQADVWARTRLLMVPSVYESYGMVAVEALASGLPVLAHPTPGLKEALGDAGTFIDRDDVPAWVAAIRDLYPDGGQREDVSAVALARSAVLADQATTERKVWAEAVRILVRA